MSPVKRGQLEREADSLLAQGKVFQSARLYRIADKPLSAERLIERGNEFLRNGDIKSATDAFVCAGFAASEPKQ
jgi:hypothetical protein